MRTFNAESIPERSPLGVEPIHNIWRFYTVRTPATREYIPVEGPRFIEKSALRRKPDERETEINPPRSNRLADLEVNPEHPAFTQGPYGSDGLMAKVQAARLSFDPENPRLQLVIHHDGRNRTYNFHLGSHHRFELSENDRTQVRIQPLGLRANAKGANRASGLSRKELLKIGYELLWHLAEKHYPRQAPEKPKPVATGLDHWIVAFQHAYEKAKG